MHVMWDLWYGANIELTLQIAYFLARNMYVLINLFPAQGKSLNMHFYQISYCCMWRMKLRMF